MLEKNFKTVIRYQRGADALTRTHDDRFDKELTDSNADDGDRVIVGQIENEAVFQNPGDAYDKDNKNKADAVKVVVRYIPNVKLSSNGRKFISDLKKQFTDLKATNAETVIENFFNLGDEDLLVIEDYYTYGLTGGYTYEEWCKIKQSKDHIVSSNERYFGLTLLDGYTTKTEERTGGSKGRGKIVLNKHSKIGTFLCITQRNDQSRVMVGKTVLGEGLMVEDEKGFTRETEKNLISGKEIPVDNNDYFAEGYDDSEGINNYCESLGITRDEAGTSMIILEPVDALKNHNLHLQSILKKGWLQIIKGKISIVLSGFVGLDNGNDFEVNKNNILELSTKYQLYDIEKSIKFYLEVLEHKKSGNSENIITSSMDTIMDRKISQKDFTEDDVTRLHEIWKSNTLGQVKIPIELKKKNEESSVTNYLNIYFKSEDGITNQVHFSRSGLIIPKALKEIARVKNGYFFVEPSDSEDEGGTLDDFLSNLEDESHESFSGKADRVEKYYEFCWPESGYTGRKDSHRKNILDTITYSVYHFFSNILYNQDDQKRDKSLFSDMINLNLPGTQTGKSHVDPEEVDDDDGQDGTTDTDIDDIEPKEIDSFKVEVSEKASNRSFIIIYNEEKDDKWVPFNLSVEVRALDEVNSTSSVMDQIATSFDLEHISFKHDGVDNFAIDSSKRNKATMFVKDKSFQFKAEGYDEHHKIKIICKNLDIQNEVKEN